LCQNDPETSVFKFHLMRHAQRQTEASNMRDRPDKQTPMTLPTLPCQPQAKPSTEPYFLSQVIRVKVERCNRGVEAKCPCQRPPSALSQAILRTLRKVDRRNHGVDAHCVSASVRPQPSPKPQLLRRSTVTLHQTFNPFNLSRSPRPSGN
jgi:hypothetical protein